MLVLKMEEEGLRAKECGWPLEAENTLWLMASKEIGTNNLKSEERLPPSNLQKGAQIY